MRALSRAARRRVFQQQELELKPLIVYVKLKVISLASAPGSVPEVVRVRICADATETRKLMFPLLLQIKESASNCPEEAALATARELATAAGDPSAELHELGKHSWLGQTKPSFRLHDLLTDL